MGREVQIQLECISASGVYLPPMLIFKRKRMEEELQPELSSIVTTVGGWTPVASTSGKDGAQARTIFHCNDSGWMDTGGFNIWQGWSSSQNYLPL